MHLRSQRTEGPKAAPDGRSKAFTHKTLQESARRVRSSGEGSGQDRKLHNPAHSVQRLVPFSVNRYEGMTYELPATVRSFPGMK